MVDNIALYLIYPFIISVFVFFLSEMVNRPYLISKTNYTLRLERFELILQDLYSYKSIYSHVKKILELEIVDTSIEIKNKLIDFNRLFEKIYLVNMLNEKDVFNSTTVDELVTQKSKLIDSIKNERDNLDNNIQVKTSSLHFIMLDETIQDKVTKITKDLFEYISKADKEKDYSDEITKDLKNLVNSMKISLPSVYGMDFIKANSIWYGLIVVLSFVVYVVLIYMLGLTR